jgi:hypothetical protein
MVKIKLFLEYQCYPMWIYDEKDELVDNVLIEELKGELEIDKMLAEIQSIYDALFEDNDISFEYKGFTLETEKEVFIQKIENVVSLIKEKVGNMYLFENRITI